MGLRVIRSMLHYSKVEKNNCPGHRRGRNKSYRDLRCRYRRAERQASRCEMRSRFVGVVDEISTKLF